MKVSKIYGKWLCSHPVPSSRLSFHIRLKLFIKYTHTHAHTHLCIQISNFEDINEYIKILKALWTDGGGNYFTVKHSLSVQFSHSVMSNSLWPHGLQHARPPCPSPTPGVHPNLQSLSQWCHPTISSSVIPFSSHLQSFPASGSFQMSQLFTSGGQSIRVPASTSVLPMNTQDWSPLGWTGWISLQSKGLSRVYSNTTVQ